MVTAAAARPPVASTTPRRLGPSTPDDGPVEAPVSTPVEPPQRGGANRSGDQGRNDVEGAGAGAQHGEHAGDAGQAHDDEQTRGLDAGREMMPATAASSRTTTSHRADQHQLVGAAELPDRELLERRRRQVDDGGADRQHRRGGGDGRGRRPGGRRRGRRRWPGRRTPRGGVVRIRGCGSGGLHAGCSERGGPSDGGSGPRTTTGGACGRMRP